jgi:hypothetical protein
LVCTIALGTAGRSVSAGTRIPVSSASSRAAHSIGFSPRSISPPGIDQPEWGGWRSSRIRPGAGASASRTMVTAPMVYVGWISRTMRRRQRPGSR